MADRNRALAGLGLAFTVLSAALAHGCAGAGELPTAPSDFTAGVIVYEHANFLGNAAHITSDVEDLRDFKGPCTHDDGESVTRDWNDCISSVRVAPGWRAILYRGPNYKDDTLEVTADVSNLQLIRQHDCPKDGLNDCVSSVRVRRQ
jgi:hypothetical protein